MVTDKATEWLSPAYDEETQKEVRAMLENEDKTPLFCHSGGLLLSELIVEARDKTLLP